MNATLNKVRIVSRPEGEAPEWVRDAWIGIELQCVYHLDAPTPQVKLLGAVTNDTIDFSPSYAVSEVEAIAELHEVNPDAAQWWINQGYPHKMEGLLFFNAGCVTPLGPIPTRAELLSQINN